jgi:hypothetical protein
MEFVVDRLAEIRGTDRSVLIGLGLAVSFPQIRVEIVRQTRGNDERNEITN